MSGGLFHDKVYDRTGRDGPRRCETPRVWYRENPHTLVRKTWLSRCNKCGPCREQRKRVRIARAMREVETSNRTWFDTRTFGFDNWLTYLADKGDPAALSIQESGKPPPESWIRRQAQHLKAGLIKRLRKQGAKVRQSTHWEAHQSGIPHAHVLIHEQRGNPTRWLQFVLASFIRHPKSEPQRGPTDTDGQYLKRLVAHNWDGWREWMSLRDTPGEAAAARRRELPFQTGITGRDSTKLCRDNTRNRKRDSRAAVSYAAKAAAYSSKAGGRWSASPGYGRPFQGLRMNTRENRNLAKAAMAALWLTVTAAANAPPADAGPGPSGPHWGAAPRPSGRDGSHPSPGWCRLAALNQELGPPGPRFRPPNPQPPPTHTGSDIRAPPLQPPHEQHLRIFPEW